MVALIQSLFEHLVWADSATLSAIRACAGAPDDNEIRKLLHHVVSVERFFLSLFQGRAFDAHREMQPPASFDDLQASFQETHRDALDYVAQLEETELAREIPMPRMENFRPTLRDLLMQVVMHSEHHRAQCAARLRALGGHPTVTDYIMWVRVSARPPAA
jgi:uncharacterized damage-inducible protein DinB